jgi:hypothetical protein
LYDGAISDVAFKVIDHIFPAHCICIILKCFAPHLAELVETYDTTNPMPIEDVDPDTFKIILGVVYGASVTVEEWKAQSKYLIDPSTRGKSILFAAHKYGIISLRIEAEEWYLKFTRLAADNVIDNLLYADGNHFCLIKKAAMDFIVENSDEVVSSKHYKNLLQSPSLLSDVVMALSKKLSADKKRKRSES